MRLRWLSLRYLCNYISNNSISTVLTKVFSGKIPFHHIARDQVVVLQVTTGQRPERPADSLFLGLSDRVWQVIEMCWQPQPDQRPVAGTVLSCFEKAVELFVPTPTITVMVTDPGPTVDPGGTKSDVFSLSECIRSYKTHRRR